LKKAVIAYDRDVMVKDQVYAALLKLGRSLEQERFDVLVRTWPDKHKGFDDFLCAKYVESNGPEVAA
jgi:predicted CopG family antitoxin